MDIELYVYDLTHGMARSMSHQFLGIQIDAVYHTSLVFENVEYFFGAGVQTCYAGSTHHGRPMEIIPMGQTQLPLETVLDYLESLKEVYTPESYDLFAHNCNNFTNDFAMFLLGKGIPAHITSLPKRVLETPFGQMLRPQIESSMRSVTQAPVPAQNVPPTAHHLNGGRSAAMPSGDKTVRSAAYGRVMSITDSATLEKVLSGAKSTCATVFFTSSTCAPCKLAYPAFDLLAEEHSNGLFVKVDINEARDVASKYQIRATPTFMTFCKGAKLDEWSGADPSQLKTNVAQLIQSTFPPHNHTTLKLPTFQFGSLQPVIYNRVPPLDKLTAKLGEGASKPEMVALRNFVQQRQKDPREAALPDLQSISKEMRYSVARLPAEVRFAAIDLLRCALVDPRVSGYYAEEQTQPLLPALISQTLDMDESCPHNLRLVTLHLASNMFTSPLFSSELYKSASSSTSLLIQLVTTSLLDVAHSTTRVAAASLAFNLAVTNYRLRREEGEEGLAESEQVEIAASILEALGNEEGSEEATKMLLLTLGYLLYCAPRDGEVIDLVQALDAKKTLEACKGEQGLVKEVISLL